MTKTKLIVLFLVLCLTCLYAQNRMTWDTSAKKIQLENGISLIYEHDESSKVSVVQISIKGGQYSEPMGKSGLAYLTTRLALEIPDYNKTQELMDQATQLYTSCQNDYTTITIACLSENLNDTFEIIAKIIQNPLISSVRIDRNKKQMEQQKKTEADQPANVSHNSYMSAFFKDTPYAFSIYGDDDNRKTIKKKDITDYYLHHFRTGNMVFVISSDLDQESISSLFSTHFENLPPGQPNEPSSFALNTSEKEPIFIHKDAQQSLVSIGFAISDTSAESYVLAIMLENLLGKGINSRLWELRMKEKLAYSVQSRLTYTRRGSLLEAYLETDNTKRDIAQSALLAVIKTLYTEGISQEELEITKTYSKSLLMQNNETKDNRTRSMAFFETMGLGYDFFEKIFPIIDAVTLDSINAYIKQYLDPDSAVSVVIGPEEETEISQFL